jgi:ribosomal protein S6--L-glutamate ligase
MQMAKRVGFWIYQNGGGDAIEQKLIQKLSEREIDVVRDLNLRHAYAKEGQIVCHGQVMEELDLFFSYNAGQQTQYQMYLYEMLSHKIPTVNNFQAFALTEDKFKTNHLLRQHGVMTPDYKLYHRDDVTELKRILNMWGGKMVYKPTDGWGGVGLVKIENEQALEMIIPFLNQTDIRYFYVERYIDYDKTDWRIDIVDGKFITAYGRKASGGDWRTNISSGGSIIMREPNDEVVNLALKAAEITGLEIAGVDIIYDREKEEYVVLEVNGIPAFATPEQEKIGLDFNNKKIDAIAGLIDKRVNGK